jgi:hypothetical protein
MSVTAVLLKYKRLDELNQIIEHLKKFPMITETIVWDNRIVNVCGLGRYLAMSQAKNDIIFTVDDDNIPLNINQLWKKYKELKSQGKEQIVNNMKLGALKKYKNFGQTMVGWGSFLPKSVIKGLNEYIQVYGVDQLLIRDTSRIITGLYGKWYSLPAKIQEFPSASDSNIALWKQEHHRINRRESIKRVNCLKSIRTK